MASILLVHAAFAFQPSCRAVSGAGAPSTYSIQRTPAAVALFGRRVDEDSKAKYAQMAKARAEEEAQQKQAIAETLQKKEEERKALYKKQADYQDKLDMFSGGGGQIISTTNAVTREMLENSRKTTSPALAAEEALGEALNDVGNLKPRVAIDMLNFQINEAKAAGVQSYSRNLKKALALLATLEASAQAPEATAEQLAADERMDAIFSAGFAMPDDDGIDFEPI